MNIREIIVEKTKNKKLTPFSQKLRKEMTKEEIHLWLDFLKRLPVTVNRQKVIGPYIVDFYCADKKTVIELDGSQHYEKEGMKQDRDRDTYLNSLGITVLRYTNLQVHRSFQAVCQDILDHIDPDGSFGAL